MRPRYDNDHERRPAIRNEDLDPALTEVSRKVIGCAIEIHTALGPGFDHETYVQAISRDLTELGVKHSVNHVFPVYYRGKEVGKHKASLFVDSRFLVQVVCDPEEVGGFERTALRAQLRSADLELGLIINFHRRRLKDGGLVRVLNPDKLEALRGHPDATDGEDDHG
ncbi:MAG: GxxExxY protein [Planctomycetota bacterium]|nr:GxxExxY protein [Planctomycetota bacterium]